jgi:shikimate kinase
MKIVLIGYRAAGKSTLGRVLSERLQWPLLDVDRGIEQQSGKPVKELFENGIEAYRDVEADVVAQMCDGHERVIAFGAGSLERPENQLNACRDAVVVYLKSSPEILWNRIDADPQSVETRPNHTTGGLEEVIEMLEKRAPVYERCATLILDATLTPEQLADAIFEQLPLCNGESGPVE